MIAAFLLMLGAAQGGVPPPLPTDWSTLPPLRYDRRPELPAGLDEFARGEVAAGRCTVPRGTPSLRVDLAILVDGGAAVRVVPRAIACPTVEQFAAGVLSRVARDRLAPDSPDGWYHATLDLALAGAARE